jgi:hypothetical protein
MREHRSKKGDTHGQQRRPPGFGQGHRDARRRQVLGQRKPRNRHRQGDIAGGIGGIVKNSIDIATHSVDKTKEMITGTRDDAEDRKAGRE